MTVIWPLECHLLLLDQGYEMLQHTSVCRKRIFLRIGAWSIGRTNVCRTRDFPKVVSREVFPCICGTDSRELKYTTLHLELSCDILVVCFLAWTGTGNEIHNIYTMHCKVTDRRWTQKLPVSCVRHHAGTLVVFLIASEFENSSCKKYQKFKALI